MSAHADLVDRAVRWLRRSRSCTRIVAEFVCVGTQEQPDAIGWRFTRSTLVEVKTSRADFRRDLTKPRHAHAAAGMGCWRWFLTPPDLVRPEELPAGWGLVEALPRSMRVVHEPDARDEYDKLGELAVLLSTLRRHELGIPWDGARGRFAALTDPAHPGRR